MIEAMKQALEAMEAVIDVADRRTAEFDALRSSVIDLTLLLHTQTDTHPAPAQPVQEPKLPEFFTGLEYDSPDWGGVVSVYQRQSEAPPKLFYQEKLPKQFSAQPSLKPLSRKQIDDLSGEGCFLGNIYEITQEIEAAHGIKE